MAITYTVWDSPRVAFATYEGDARTADVVAMFQHYLSHPDFDVEIPHFADLTKLGGVDATSQDMKNLADMYISEYEERGGKMFTAHLVEKGGLAQGMSRVFDAYVDASDAVTILMFDDRQETIKWLNIRAPKNPRPLVDSSVYKVENGIVIPVDDDAK